MVWEKLRHTKEEINHAGRILSDPASSEEEIKGAIEILDNWRAVHSYPLHVFQRTLLNKTKRVEKKSKPIVAQRLKRSSAIIYKLNRSYYGRKPSMKLYQMQDIGGCRSILPTVAQARRLVEEHYLRGDLKHKRVNYKDYVVLPKDDGYRSFHIVYEYRSDKGSKEYNGLLIEVQIRSKLQHLWATAIETVDFFTRQPIKTNEGPQEWTDFFRLVSSAFAMIEGCPIVPKTISNEKELYLEIKKKEKELNVISKLNSWAKAMKFFKEEDKDKKKKGSQFFLLELDILGERLNITGYPQELEQAAILDYSKLEKRHAGQKDYDVVLVGFDNLTDLKKAYPNYFIDTDEFLIHLKRIISKYP
ncbi:RelA/SpoT domain-containing protein [Candidatus Woesearchaeota archaeon]|nr:RelA/SpoT domain-containing protein [Candidatus Woesearchaeota archaeon]